MMCLSPLSLEALSALSYFAGIVTFWILSEA